MKDINRLVEKYEQYIIKLRRYFNENPESSWHEFNTSKKIKEELNLLGVEYKDIANTGILAEIKGGKSGKTVLLRADMDALCVGDKIIHGCGHDGHVAMLLGAAKILNEIRENIKGSVKLLFQPAEEVGEGACKCIEEGALNDVDTAFSIHLWSDIQCGKVSVDEGARMSSADIFTIDILGKGGHGAMPHQGVDSVVAASSLVLNLQSIVSREIDPLEPTVITIGKLEAGSRFNVIASEAHIEGTVRCFNEDIRKNMKDIMTRIVKSSSETFRAKGLLNYKFATPVTINNEICSNIAKKSVIGILGEEGIVKTPPVTVTEDFGFILQKVPGVLALVGVRNEEKGIIYPQHHPNYDIDENSLKIGTALYCEYVLNFLGV